jgi:hypothetical protein
MGIDVVPHVNKCVNGMDRRFKILIRFGRLKLFGRYEYVEIRWFSMIKIFSHAGNLFAHNYASFMVSLQRVENGSLFMKVSTRLENTTSDIFIQHE